MVDELADFGATFSTFMKKMSAQTPDEDTPFKKRLRGLFEADPALLPVVSEQFGQSEHANIDLAIAAYLEDSDSHEVVGIAGIHDFYGASFSSLVTGSARQTGMGTEEGPVEYKNISTGIDEVRSCVGTGLFMIRRADGPIAVLVQAPGQHQFGQEHVTVSAMATDKAYAERFLATIREAMRKNSVYRGRVISIAQTRFGGTNVEFHALPEVPRDDIILPSGLLDAIERHAVGFARHRDKLRAAKRHLKRGLLLYGPPGTGKTMTAMFIAGRMLDRTVLLLTGHSLGLIERYCTMARHLEPSTVILEDVDLIATLRDKQSTGTNAVLFDLLNQMDGLSEDADVLFVLTTNRPDILEPALAARPGRIDMALEVPLPDADCRRRLFELYGAGLSLELEDADALVERTEGVSAAFVRELFRRAALVAADETGEVVVTDSHVATALKELTLDGDHLTTSLLGASGMKRRPSC